MKIGKLLLAILLVVSSTNSYAQRKIINIPPPYGFTKCESDAYGTYLRNLPLKPAGSLVKLHNGSVKGYQDGAHAIIDMEIGTSDITISTFGNCFSISSSSFSLGTPYS